MSKCVALSSVIGLACFCLAFSASATVLVDDTWQDGNRNQPDAPTNAIPYAENNGSVAVDADSDLDLESRWLRGSSGTGTLDPVGAGGPLRGTVAATTSSNWTTYFTDAEGNEVELVNVGDKLNITWYFTLNGVNALNLAQSFRLAVVDSPSRQSADGFPEPTAVFPGYGMFGNMGQTFGHIRPFDLMTRNAGSGALLSASAAWTSAGVQDGTNGNAGYANGVAYSYSFMAERMDNDDLQVTMSMAGNGLDGGANSMQSIYLDTNPASFKFDTFAVRPSRADQTATTFDTSRFVVEFTPLLIGDYNGDGKVSAADFTVWRDHLRASTLANRDPNNIGPVDINDFNSWKDHYGESLEGSGSGAGVTTSAVPEPAAWILTTLGGLVAMRFLRARTN